MGDGKKKDLIQGAYDFVSFLMNGKGEVDKDGNPIGFPGIFGLAENAVDLLFKGVTLLLKGLITAVAAVGGLAVKGVKKIVEKVRQRKAKNKDDKDHSEEKDKTKEKEKEKTKDKEVKIKKEPEKEIDKQKQIEVKENSIQKPEKVENKKNEEPAKEQVKPAEEVKKEDVPVKDQIKAEEVSDLTKSVQQPSKNKLSLDKIYQDPVAAIDEKFGSKALSQKLKKNVNLLKDGADKAVTEMQKNCAEGKELGADNVGKVMTYANLTYGIFSGDQKMIEGMGKQAEEKMARLTDYFAKTTAAKMYSKNADSFMKLLGDKEALAKAGHTMAANARLLSVNKKKLLDDTDLKQEKKMEEPERKPLSRNTMSLKKPNLPGF